MRDLSEHQAFSLEKLLQIRRMAITSVALMQGGEAISCCWRNKAEAKKRPVPDVDKTTEQESTKGWL
ncbi:hypothetical protein [Erwinia aphidicola]|uniref:hypothetical protein n=1 Tax=Erwinia aphidicola TaxID=68334 RepID=UPI003019D80E